MDSILELIKTLKPEEIELLRKKIDLIRDEFDSELDFDLPKKNCCRRMTDKVLFLYNYVYLTISYTYNFYFLRNELTEKKYE